MDENTYPHKYYIYEITNDKTQELICFCQQQDMHSDILILKYPSQNACEHHPEHLGSIHRNYWGTRFQLNSHGIPEQ